MLAATTRPKVDRLFKVVCRNAKTSTVTNAAEVKSSTKPLVTSRIAVSFRLIGQSRSAISPPRRSDDLGHAQQLGADGQVGRLRCREVQLETDATPVGDEANHAAAEGEAVGITHCEERPAPETRQNLLRPVGVGPTDEHDVARLDLVDALIAPHLEWPPAQVLMSHGLVQEAPERG